MKTAKTAGPARAFGLDLAWSDTNRTGACALDESGCIVDERWLGSDDDIVGWVESHLPTGAPSVIAVDAPLLVPNESGQRPCETRVSKAYGARKASAHSSNRPLLIRLHKRVRGEDLAQRLALSGFMSPFDHGDRVLLEVYPHPALIEIFGLKERLRYKAKRGFGIAQCREGLRSLEAKLAELAQEVPPLLGPPVEIDDSMRGTQLKDIEDKLDARLCAWLALLWHIECSTAFELYGDASSGHIGVPRARNRHDEVATLGRSGAAADTA